MRSVAVTVETSAVLVVAPDDKYRQVTLHNAGGQKVYLGGSNVTTTTGIHLGNGESLTIEVPIRETLYAITESGTNNVIVLLPDGD